MGTPEPIMNRPAGILVQVRFRVGCKAALGSWASSDEVIPEENSMHAMQMKK